MHLIFAYKLIKEINGLPVLPVGGYLIFNTCCCILGTNFHNSVFYSVCRVLAYTRRVSIWHCLTHLLFRPYNSYRFDKQNAVVYLNYWFYLPILLLLFQEILPIFSALFHTWHACGAKCTVEVSNNQRFHYVIYFCPFLWESDHFP